MRAGTQAMRSGDPDTALAAFEKAVRLQPQHPVALAFLGATLLELDRPAEAVARLEQAVALEPSLFVAWHNLGLARLRLGRPEEAVAALDNALGLRPDDDGVRLVLGRALTEAGRPGDALPHLEAVAARQPAAFVAHQYLGTTLLRLDRFTDALEAFEAADRLKPDDPEILYGKALAHVGLDDVDEAVPILRDVVTLAPGHTDGWTLLGRALARQPGNLEAGVRAAEALERALELRPGDPGAALELAQLYRRLGLFQEGLDVLDTVTDAATDAITGREAAVPASPDRLTLPTTGAVPAAAGSATQIELERGRLLTLLGRYQDAGTALERAADAGAGAPAWYRLGIVARNLADLDAAITAFAEAIRLSPDLAAAHRELGDLLIDRQRYGEARATLEQAVAADPGDARSHYLLGLAILRAGDPAASVAPLEHALELDPEFASAAYNLGTALRLTGEMEASRAAMERFKELSDRQEGTVGQVDRTRAEIATLNRQGLYYYRRGETESAVERFERALELEPDGEVVFINLGLAYAALGNHERAVAAFERARERNPDRAEIYAALAEEYAALGRTEEAARMRARYEDLRHR